MKNEVIDGRLVMTILTILIMVSMTLITAFWYVEITASETVHRSNTATAQEVYMLPQHGTVAPGNMTEVEIWVNASDFFGGQINLAYDPCCVNVTNWERNTPVFPLGGGTQYEGRAWITFSAAPPTRLLSGNYLIGQLTIQSVTEKGQCCETSLAFVEPSGLFDDRGLSVTVGWLDGTFICCDTELIVDTEPGEYPSIAGTHNGTITPSCTIQVSQLYTYPCPGTGGHTEYVKIWQGITPIAEKNWGGYLGDWYNISFDESFTLYANQTYNYTIRTGSYPQIIHKSFHNATGGKITCTDFVDLNGKRHEGWIPAIRLS